MNYYDLFLTTLTRARVSYTNEGRICPNTHQTGMNEFMLQSDTRASRSMDMDGWVGVMVGKIGLFWGGIMMRSATFSSLSLPVVDLPWFGVFYLAFCFSWGADAVIPLPIAKVCQEVYAFPVLFYDSTIAFF